MTESEADFLSPPSPFAAALSLFAILMMPVLLWVMFIWLPSVVIEAL